MLSPLLYSLYTNNYTSQSDSIKLIKFVDETTLVTLVLNDEPTYQTEVISVGIAWSQQLNAEHAKKQKTTVEIITDFRRKHPPHLPY